MERPTVAAFGCEPSPKCLCQVAIAFFILCSKLGLHTNTRIEEYLLLMPSNKTTAVLAH